MFATCARTVQIPPPALTPASRPAVIARAAPETAYRRPSASSSRTSHASSAPDLNTSPSSITGFGGPSVPVAHPPFTLPLSSFVPNLPLPINVPNLPQPINTPAPAPTPQNQARSLTSGQSGSGVQPAMTPDYLEYANAELVRTLHERQAALAMELQALTNANPPPRPSPYQPQPPPSSSRLRTKQTKTAKKMVQAAAASASSSSSSARQKEPLQRVMMHMQPLCGQQPLAAENFSLPAHQQPVAQNHPGPSGALSDLLQPPQQILPVDPLQLLLQAATAAGLVDPQFGAPMAQVPLAAPLPINPPLQAPAANPDPAAQVSSLAMWNLHCAVQQQLH